MTDERELFRWTNQGLHAITRVLKKRKNVNIDTTKVLIGLKMMSMEDKNITTNISDLIGALYTLKTQGKYKTITDGIRTITARVGREALGFRPSSWPYALFRTDLLAIVKNLLIPWSQSFR